MYFSPFFAKLRLRENLPLWKISKMSKYNSSAILQMNSDIITLCGENTFPICVNSREEANCTEIHFAKVIALVGDSHSRRWLQIKNWNVRMPYTNVRMRGNLNFCFSWTRVKMRLCTHFGKVIAPVVGVADIVCRHFCCCCTVQSDSCLLLQLGLLGL